MNHPSRRKCNMRSWSALDYVQIMPKSHWDNYRFKWPLSIARTMLNNLNGGGAVLITAPATPFFFCYSIYSLYNPCVPKSSNPCACSFSYCPSTSSSPGKSIWLAFASATAIFISLMKCLI